MALHVTRAEFIRRNSCVTHSGTPASCTPTTTNREANIYKDNSVNYGANVPNYKRVIALGGNATTNLVGLKYTASAGVASYWRRMKISSPFYPSQGCSSFVSTVGQNLNTLTFTDAPIGVSSVAQEQAASALLSSYIDATNSWRGGSFLAEFAETVKMLRSPLEGIHKNTWALIRKVTSMKRLFRRDPRAYARLLGGAWLSWAFGVRPLLSDIGSIERALSEMSTTLYAHDKLPIRGSGQDSSFGFVYANGSAPQMDASLHDQTLEYTYSVRYKGAVIAHPPGSYVLLQHFGFTPEDIAPAVWEGIPWSFLVDYFVNVNEKLDSLRWATANLAWLQRTTRTRAVRRWSNIRPPAPGSSALLHYDVHAAGGAAWTACTRVSRAPAPVPYPAWKFKIPNSLEQWINIAALAAGIRASKPTPAPYIPRIDIGDL